MTDTKQITFEGRQYAVPFWVEWDGDGDIFGYETKPRDLKFSWVSDDLITACATHIDLCLDHKIPESKGGKASVDNLQTLCRSCNSAKGVKL